MDSKLVLADSSRADDVGDPTEPSSGNADVLRCTRALR